MSRACVDDPPHVCAPGNPEGKPAAFCSGVRIDPSACICGRIRWSGLRDRNRVRRRKIRAYHSMRVFSSLRTSAQ
jgi:hypothetical protein